MLFLTFLVVIVGCYARDPAQNTVNHIKVLQDMTPEEFRATVCPDLDRSRGLLKCAPEETEDFYKQATSYINRYGKPNAVDLQPIVILPGMGGSALQAKIKKNEAPHWWCWQNWDEWFRDWLPLYELLSQDCWFDNLKIDYNESTNEYNNQPGVTIDVMDFGGLSGIDYLDYWFGWPVPFTTYYSSMIKSFEVVGYETGKTVFGAPYDWRLPSSAHELDEQAFNARFLHLIEHAYETTGGKRVHIVTHSMGGPTTLAFLNNRPQAWLDKYIASFIPIAGPWAGSAKALRTSLTGDNFGIEVLGFNLLNIEAVAKLAKQAGGIIELIPHSRFYKQDYVFVKTPQRTYTAKDFVQLYKDADSPISATIHQQTEKLFDQWAPPRVVTHCLYGFGFKTEISFNYKDGLKQQPEIDYGNNGDGTVPLESLQECLTWGASQKPPVYVKEFNLDHSAILEDQELFAYILNITTNSTGF